MASKTQTYFFIGTLLAALALTFFIFQPYLTAVAVGGIFAVVFQPIYRALLKKIKNESLTAFATIILVLIVVLVPLSFIGSQLVDESRDLYLRVSDENAPATIDVAADWVDKYFPDARINIRALDIGEYFGQFLNTVAGSLGAIFSSIINVVIRIVIMLMTLYYLLKEGDRVQKRIIEISPLGEDDDKQILKRLALATGGIVRGSLVISAIQGILTGVGFAIFGIPSPTLWGSIAVIAALIPGVGTALVIVPGVIFAGLTGSPGAAIGLLIWGIVAVGLIDNLLRPFLIKRDVGVHQFFIFLSVIGGITFFGPIGILLGPLVLSFLFVLLEMSPVLLKR